MKLEEYSTIKEKETLFINGGSKIVYDESYGDKVREIQLFGEAYFDVVHNAEKPFIIHTKQLNIKVLGTAFNVRAYQNDKTTEAALIRGSIEVSFPNRPNENLILKPNEKITVLNSENIGTKKTNIDYESKRDVITVSKLNYEIKDSAVVETAIRRKDRVPAGPNYLRKGSSVSRKIFALSASKAPSTRASTSPWRLTTTA